MGTIKKASRPLCTLFFIFLLAACQPSSAAHPETLVDALPPATSRPAPPTLAPTQSSPPPTIPVVTDFVDGQNEMPPDKYLFIEYWNDYTGTGAGTCEGAAMIDFPEYGYSSGSLSAPLIDMSRGMFGMASSLVGFFGYGDSNNGTMGGGISSSLYVIATLPYSMSAGTYELGVIHSVDAQGGVIVEFNNTIYQLDPGRSWVQVAESDLNPGCHLIVTTRLTNYGLLDKQSVSTSSNERLDYLRRIGATNAPYQLGWYDSETLAFASRTGLSFYSTSPLAQTREWTTSAPILSMALSPDKSLLASADTQGMIQMWDTASGQPLGELQAGPEGPWISLVFSPNGEILASGSWDGIIQRWDVQTKQAIGLPLVTHTEQVMKLMYSSDGNLLLSSGENSPAQVWNSETNEVQQWSQECVAMALSPDGSKLACLETDIGNGAPTLNVIDAKTREILGIMQELPGTMYDLAFSPDGALLAGGSNNGLAQLWNVSTGEVQGRWTLAGGQWFDQVIDVAFSPDGNKLAVCNRTGGNDWTLWILDRETNEITQLTGIK